MCRKNVEYLIQCSDKILSHFSFVRCLSLLLPQHLSLVWLLLQQGANSNCQQENGHRRGKRWSLTTIGEGGIFFIPPTPSYVYIYFCVLICRVQRWNKLTLVSFLSFLEQRWAKWLSGFLQRPQGEQNNMYNVSRVFLTLQMLSFL